MKKRDFVRTLYDLIIFSAIIMIYTTSHNPIRRMVLTINNIPRSALFSDRMRMGNLKNSVSHIMSV